MIGLYSNDRFGFNKVQAAIARVFKFPFLQLLTRMERTMPSNYVCTLFHCDYKYFFPLPLHSGHSFLTLPSPSHCSQRSLPQLLHRSHSTNPTPSHSSQSTTISLSPSHSSHYKNFGENLHEDKRSNDIINRLLYFIKEH